MELKYPREEERAARGGPVLLLDLRRASFQLRPLRFLEDTFDDSESVDDLESREEEE